MRLIGSAARHLGNQLRLALAFHGQAIDGVAEPATDDHEPSVGGPVERAYVRMIEAGDCPPFAFEPLSKCGI